MSDQEAYEALLAALQDAPEETTDEEIARHLAPVVRQFDSRCDDTVIRQGKPERCKNVWVTEVDGDRFCTRHAHIHQRANDQG